MIRPKLTRLLSFSEAVLCLAAQRSILLKIKRQTDTMILQT